MTGIDFNDDSEFMRAAIEEQKEAYENSSSFAFTNEESIIGEMVDMINRTRNVSKHLSRMVEDNDYENTANMCLALTMSDLGDSGWIRSYSRKNTQILTADPRAVTISDDDASQQGFYVGRQYIKDINVLADVCYHCALLLRGFPLLSVYRHLMWTENFADAGFDKDLYHLINTEVGSANYQFWKSPNDFATDYSRALVQKYRSEGRDPKASSEAAALKRARIREFQSEVRKRGFQSLIEREDGSYRTKADWISKMQVIDSYTDILSRQDPIEDDMEETVEACRKLIAEKIRPAEKQLTIAKCQNVIAALEELVKTIQSLAQRTLDVYELFSEGKDAPYCFMKTLSEVKAARPRFKFDPDKSDPWDKGTSYKRMYEQIADSLTEQCHVYIAYWQAMEER